MDSKILVITDSASDITRQSAQSRNIRILPIMITSGGRTFAEYYDITPGAVRFSQMIDLQDSHVLTSVFCTASVQIGCGRYPYIV